MNEERESLARPDDEQEIDIRNSWQVLLWCRTLGITKSQLEEAINAVGTDADAITRYISNKD